MKWGITAYLPMSKGTRLAGLAAAGDLTSARVMVGFLSMAVRVVSACGLRTDACSHLRRGRKPGSHCFWVLLSHNPS